MDLVIEQPVHSPDTAKIAALLDVSFAPNTYESKLVRALLDSRRTLIDWVVRDRGAIIAYIAFTTAYRGSESVGHHLAPLAVLPGYQRKGIGTALVSQALQNPALCTSPVFVLGSTRYYARFGFKSIVSPACPFDPGNPHFQALRWSSPDVFTIGYEPEFHTS